MCRYVWSLDSKDWASLAPCIAPDLVFQASDMGRYETAEALIRAFQRRGGRLPVRRHSIFNCRVRIDGDRAVFTSYLVKTRWRPGVPGGKFGMVIG